MKFSSCPRTRIEQRVEVVHGRQRVERRTGSIEVGLERISDRPGCVRLQRRTSVRRDEFDLLRQIEHLPGELPERQHVECTVGVAVEVGSKGEAGKRASRGAELCAIDVAPRDDVGGDLALDGLGRMVERKVEQRIKALLHPDRVVAAAVARERADERMPQHEGRGQIAFHHEQLQARHDH